MSVAEWWSARSLIVPPMINLVNVHAASGEVFVRIEQEGLGGEVIVKANRVIGIVRVVSQEAGAGLSGLRIENHNRMVDRKLRKTY